MGGIPKTTINSNLPRRGEQTDDTYLDIGERQLEGHVLHPQQGVVWFSDHEPLEVSCSLGDTVLKHHQQHNQHNKKHNR